MLLCPVTEEEVRKALFHMHSYISPRPDGMTPGFYQKYWRIIGKDVVDVVKHFVNTGNVDPHLDLYKYCPSPEEKETHGL